MRGWIVVAVVCALPLPAAAQDSDARLERILARWTAASRPAPREATPSRELQEAHLVNAHELWCRTQPPSCRCGGYPAGPALRDGNFGEIRERVIACYENRLHANRRLRGRIRIEAVIAPAGHVIDVRARENTTGDEHLARCVAHAMRSLRFAHWDRRRGNARASWPIIFAPHPPRPAPDPEPPPSQPSPPGDATTRDD